MAIVTLFYELIRVAIGTRDGLSRLPSEREWDKLYKMAKKQSLDELPVSYQQVFREVFVDEPKNPAPKSWTGRRLDLFRRIIRHRRYYTQFGYCSMPRFLLRSLLSHFFSKDVSL